MRASDEHGAPVVVEATGLEARVIQHEIDHLDGVLILDRTSRDQRKQAMRAMREAMTPRCVAVRRRVAHLVSRSAHGLPRHLELRRRPSSSGSPAARTGRRWSSRGPTGRRAAAARLSPPPVAMRARQLGLDVIQPERLHEPEALERIAAAEPEALCVCAYGVLIKEPLLSAYEMLNVHPSLLPRWRGAAPLERAIMAGDEQTGVSIMRADRGAGLRGRVPAGGRADRAPTTTTARSRPGSSASAATCSCGRSTSSRRSSSRTSRRSPTRTRSRRPTERSTRRVTPVELERTVRALRPHIGARVALPGGDFLGVIAARVAGGDGLSPGGCTRDDGRLLLGAAGGALELTEIRPPGGRPMAAGDWLRGRPDER